MTRPFPKSPTFMTIDEPFRFEGELYDLEVEGEIPAAHRSDLVILDAQHVDEGPVATIKIPVRLKYGIHGNQAPAAAIR